MRHEAAIRRIESFGKRFGPSRSHLYLAYHAAFPLALTPDLLYRIWANFQRDIHRKLLNIPWIAVADILLSNLCDEVGHELYEMDVAVRNELLKQLKEDSRFGEKRINELSNFLLAYVRKDLHSSESDQRDFAQSQRWTALAYKDSEQAARELALAFNEAYQQDRAELVRLATLTETLAQPLQECEKLLIYARAMGHYARKRLEDAKIQVSGLPIKGRLLSISGVILPIPLELITTNDPDPETESVSVPSNSPVNLDLRGLGGDDVKVAEELEKHNQKINIEKATSEPLRFKQTTPSFFAYDDAWVGRKSLIEDLSHRIRASWRLLILVGITGIGKTALGERLGVELLDWFYEDWSKFHQENFDKENQSNDFASVAARWLEKWGEQITPEDSKDTQHLLYRLVRHLRENRHLVLMDSLQNILKWDEDEGCTNFQDEWWVRFFQSLLAAESCQSCIILTSQDLPTQILIIGMRYQKLWHCQPLSGLEEIERLALFEKTGLDVGTESIGKPYLERIGRAYEGHPLALRVIAGEIRNQPFEGNVLAYWNQYEPEVEKVEEAIEEAKTKGITASADDNFKLHGYTRNLRRTVRVRLEKTFNRLQKDVRYAYILLCEASVYRCPVPEDFWLSHLENWGVDQEEQQVALEALRDRYLVEEAFESNQRLLRQHNLIRSMSLECLKQLDRESSSIPPIVGSEKVSVELKSQVEADYRQLQELLGQGRWKKADEETARLMLKIADREKEGWLRVEDIEEFPSSDLQTIDQLWVEYSNGRFGFSVQKQIYQSLGGTKEFNQKITEAFWHKVGLRVNNQPYWSQYDNLTFNLSAPIGHLPIRYDVETPAGVFGVIESLFSRPDLEIKNTTGANISINLRDINRDALVVGINRYPFLSHLTTAAFDAEAIAQILEQYGNFQVRRFPHTIADSTLQVDPNTTVTAAELENAITQLFLPNSNSIPDTALLFFAGHGLRRQLENTNLTEGYLATSDASPRKEKWGISLKWLRELLRKSPVRQQIVWLDCCNSGELFNFIEDDLLDESTKQCFFITASREFESAYSSLSTQHGALTEVLLKGLDPTRNSEGLINNFTLTRFIEDKLRQTPQRGMIKCADREILLTCTDRYRLESLIFKQNQQPLTKEASPTHFFFRGRQRG